MTTNHCENHVRFFSQWSGRVAAGFEAWRKTGFVIGPARKAKIETQRTLRTQTKTVCSAMDRDADLGLRVQFPMQRRGENSNLSDPWVLKSVLDNQGVCHLPPCVKKVAQAW